MSESENPWKRFFDQHAPVYMQEVFTKNTAEEIEFLLEELSLPEGSHILDVGCGTGRHAVELARRGYQVTGVDISSGMLQEARKAADQAGVSVKWIQTDATAMQLEAPAGGAICLCEGAFGLIATPDEVLTHELEILQAIHRSIKPSAKLILNAPNGLAKIRAATTEQVEAGTFDPQTLAETFELEIPDPEGPLRLRVQERGFIPSEMRLLLEITGFHVEAIYGGTAGSWNRSTVALDEIEIMAIARRT